MQTQLITGTLPAARAKLNDPIKWREFVLLLAFYSRLWQKPIAFTYYRCDVYIKKETN